MDKTEALEKLQEIARRCEQTHDYEEAHIDADNVLCDLLLSLGYNEIVNEYKKIGKWYA